MAPLTSRPQLRPGLSLFHRLMANWLITDPNYIVSSEGGPLRRYQVQMHENMPTEFLCGGRLRTIRRFPLNVLVGLVIVALGVLYFVFEAAWTWHHLSPAVVIIFAYLWLLTFMFFLRAAMSDPGIQPRNVHIPMDVALLASECGPEEYFNTVSLPYYSDKKHGVTVKYCATCHIWRAPRTSHCAVCNVCVANHDHHCKFLNNCVGYRNYRYFIWFLVCAVLVTIYLVVFSFIHCYFYLWHQVSDHGAIVTTFRQSISHTPVSLLLAVAGCVSLVYPLMLFVFHVFLSANNFTTREYLNYVLPSLGSDDRYVNVFDRGGILRNLWTNCMATPQGVSFVRPRETYVAGDITMEGIPALRMFDST